MREPTPNMFPTYLIRHSDEEYIIFRFYVVNLSVFYVIRLALLFFFFYVPLDTPIIFSGGFMPKTLENTCICSTHQQIE